MWRQRPRRQTSTFNVYSILTWVAIPNAICVSCSKVGERSTSHHRTRARVRVGPEWTAGSGAQRPTCARRGIGCATTRWIGWEVVRPSSEMVRSKFRGRAGAHRRRLRVAVCWQAWECGARSRNYISKEEPCKCASWSERCSLQTMHAAEGWWEGWNEWIIFVQPPCLRVAGPNKYDSLWSNASTKKFNRPEKGKLTITMSRPTRSYI